MLKKELVIIDMVALASSVVRSETKEKDRNFIDELDEKMASGVNASISFLTIVILSLLKKNIIHYRMVQG